MAEQKKRKTYRIDNFYKAGKVAALLLTRYGRTVATVEASTEGEIVTGYMSLTRQARDKFGATHVRHSSTGYVEAV